jgi:hypothetical protein
MFWFERLLVRTQSLAPCAPPCLPQRKVMRLVDHGHLWKDTAFTTVCHTDPIRTTAIVKLPATDQKSCQANQCQN